MTPSSAAMPAPRELFPFPVGLVEPRLRAAAHSSTRSTRSRARQSFLIDSWVHEACTSLNWLYGRDVNDDFGTLSAMQAAGVDSLRDRIREPVLLDALPRQPWRSCAGIDPGMTAAR